MSTAAPENMQPVPRSSEPTASGLIKSAFKERAFFIAVAVLLFSALTLNFAAAFLKIHFQKLDVPLRQPLANIPSQFGGWVQYSVDEPADEEMVRELGTHEFINRSFVNVRGMRETPAQVVDKLATLKGKERTEYVSSLVRLANNNVVSLHVPYYTGSADTVPHVPDRCMLANGYHTNDGSGAADWNVGRDKPIPVTYLSFESDDSHSRRFENVAYLFICNGQTVRGSLEVRAILANLRVRYGYFAKIEISQPSLQANGKQAGEDALRDFLTDALPGIEKVLPNWAEYEGK